VSAHKRLIVFSALALVVFVGSAKTTEAQGFRGRARVVVVGGFYANPYWLYDPWYGFEGQWGYPMYPPPYYRYRIGAPEASVRLEVKPKEAEVFVDGYYAGIVDDFDGVFQRLHVAPGAHEIELYLDGYRTVRQKVYLPLNDTFKIKYTMERLAAGEQPEPRPQPIEPPAPPQQPGGYPPQAGGYPPQQGAYPPPPPQGRPPAGRRMPPPQQQPPDAPPAAQASAYGTLSVRVQPADAEISIDGEQWRGPSERDRLVVDVAEGSHTVEIRKAGYRTYVTSVQVRRGETTPINVSLRSQEQP
jgi:hypothetical protein